MKNFFSNVLFVLAAFLMAACQSEDADAMPSNNDKNTTGNSRTLIVYYSYTNNTEEIVTDLKSLISADVVEIEPAEKGLDYAANNYKIGTEQLNKIKNNPNLESSYPAIDPVEVDMSQYNTVIIATPLWWSQMASNMQTFLFKYGKEMEGKNIGLIVSSHSSGINGVESDAKRLVPDGNFLSKSLWINNSNHPKRKTLIEEWLKDVNFSELESNDNTMILNVNGHSLTVELADNSSAEALLALLKEGPVTYEANDYGDFEKVGDVELPLPQNNEQITTQAGDIVLYNGNSICIFYGSNSWSYTRLGRIQNVSPSELKDILGEGNVKITLSLQKTAAITSIPNGQTRTSKLFDINGKPLTQVPERGFYIENGVKKIKQ